MSDYLEEVFIGRIWAIGATNELAVQWKATLWNQQGQPNQNQGLTVVHLRNGKVVLAQDFIFDLSPSFFQAPKALREVI